MKFTVLLPVYYGDNAEYLSEAIESVINQTVMPDEILIVVDGPINNDLSQVLEIYSRTYREIIDVIYFEENRGLGHVLKEGVVLSKCEIIARMDADDISLSDRFEKQILAFKKDSSLSLVGCNIQEYSYDMTEKLKKRVVPNTLNDIKKFSKTRNPFNHMTVMFKKNEIIEVGNYQDMPLFEDYYLWIRLLLKEKKVQNIPDVLVNVRAGRELIGKRSGYTYFQKEIRFQNKLLMHKYISIGMYIVNILTRGLSRVIPSKLIAEIYDKILRNN